MKWIFLALVCGGLLVPAIATAGHLNGTLARELARQGQREICEREPACIGTHVGACARVTGDKFRCEMTETYGRRPKLRICKFNAAIALFIHTFRVRDGYIHCYNPAGELIAEGEVTQVHPV
jgi:hypothetical protein